MDASSTYREQGGFGGGGEDWGRFKLARGVSSSSWSSRRRFARSFAADRISIRLSVQKKKAEICHVIWCGCLLVVARNYLGTMKLVRRGNLPTLVLAFVIAISVYLLTISRNQTSSATNQKSTKSDFTYLGVRGVTDDTAEAVALPLNTKYLVQRKKNVKAVIRTCPRCRLNRLPQVRKFVMEYAPLYKKDESMLQEVKKDESSGRAKEESGGILNVDFIMGEDPKLFLYMNGKVKEKIELDHFPWKKIVEKLARFGILPERATPEFKKALVELKVIEK